VTPSYIIEAPTYDALNDKLTVKTAAASTLQIYSATEGKPSKIVVDNQDWGEGAGWTWDGANNIVTTLKSGVVHSIIWAGGGGGGGGDAGAGGGGGDPYAPPLILESPAEAIGQAVQDIAVNRPNMDTMSWGVLAIAGIITIALVYRHVENQAKNSPDKAYNQLQKRLNQPMKWPVHKSKKPNWDRKKRWWQQ